MRRRDSRIFRALSVAALLAGPVIAVPQDYEVDPGFAPIFNARINVVDIALDQKILVGGRYDTNNGVLTRLNADGIRDTSFNPPFTPSDEVTSVEALPDGKILVGGVFRSVGPDVRIVRLNPDGSLDPSLTTRPTIPLGVSYTPLTKAIAQPDGKFLACGFFMEANGQPRKALARFNYNGTLDTTLATTLTRTDGYEPLCVDIEIYPNGQILILGTFSHVNGVQTYGKARLNPDGSLDGSFQLGSGYDYFNSLILNQNGSILATVAATSYGQGGEPDTIFTGVKQYGQSGGSSPSLYVSCNSFTSVSPTYPAAYQHDEQRLLITGCKSPWNNLQYNFGRFRADGTFDQTMDYINFHQSNASVRQIARQADGSYILIGDFSIVNYLPRINLVRLRPRTVPNYATDFDFDGDRRADLAVFRPSDQYWYVKLSGGGYSYIPLGLATDKLVAADYDNDGRADPAVYREGRWYILRSSNGTRDLRTFGSAADTPLVGHVSLDDTIDDKADLVIRRPFTTSNSGVAWSFREYGQTYTNGGILPNEDVQDKPVLADFDGDSVDEFGGYRNGVWRTIARGGTTGIYGSPNSIRQVNFGVAGDVPVPADYDGDGQADYAVFRPGTGVWHINGSAVGYYAIGFGTSTDVPVPADYDGDGKTDIAVFRDGVWHQYRSNGGVYFVEQWGLGGDRPIPAQFIQ